MTTRKKRILAACGVVVVAVAAFRFYLPTMVLRYVNRELNRIPDYKGHVADINIRLWRGAYQIRGARLEKMSGKVPAPFFSADLIDLSIDWRALFHRSLSGEIIFYRPRLNFVKGPTREASQTEISKGGTMQAVKRLMPFKINRLQIQDGEVHFRDLHAKPEVDLRMTDVQASVWNLTNVMSKSKPLPASLRGTARCFDSGLLMLDVDLDPFNENPTFELKQRLTGVQLDKLNDFLDAYAKIKAKSGTFDLFSEIAAKDGSYTGYVKPIIKHLKIDKQKGSKKPLKEAWAYITAIVGKVFQNQKKKQLATKIPIHGSFGKTKVDVWTAIANLLKNAFVRAIMPTLDQTIHLSDVKSKE